MGLRGATELRPSTVRDGHRHGWDLRTSRRRFLAGSAGVVGTAAVIGSGVLNPAIARAGTPKPRPIPGGLDIPDLGQFHVYAPAKGNELNTITDFKGLVAATEIQGTGAGTDSPVPPATSLVYDVDMRIMQGTFVATDGRSHEGTFGFV